MPAVILDPPEVVTNGPAPPPAPGGPAAPRPVGRAVALGVVSLVTAYLCYLLLVPLLPGVAWAVALATVSLPLHRRLLRVTPGPNWAAGLTVGAVVAVLVGTVLLVGDQLTSEAARTSEKVQGEMADGRWRETLARVPVLNEWLGRVEPYVSVEQEARRAVEALGRGTLGIVQGSMYAALQMLVAVFVLFFCLRDRHRLLDEVRNLLPMAAADAERAIARVDDAIHATVYGTILTGVIQGATGGLMFWLLGLPAPALWGVVMTVLSILPVLGAFLVWVPAAAYLVTVDRFGAAAALVAWGVLMAGPICNTIYAFAAGDRMKLHPVPVLLSFVGGLAVFGVTGMVLGPAILAFASALVDAWREHVLRGGSPAA